MKLEPALLQPGGGAIALLRPKAPMLAWVRALPPESEALSVPQTLTELSREMSVFWLPIEDAAPECCRYVRQHWQRVWEAELVQWTENRNLWPARRRQSFEEWFEIEVRELVYALE